MSGNKYNVCQVCGEPIEGIGLNCSLHRGTRQSSASLAQHIHSLTAMVPSQQIPVLAVQFGVTGNTIRNHLRREGFMSARMWRNKRLEALEKKSTPKEPQTQEERENAQ